MTIIEALKTNNLRIRRKPWPAAEYLDTEPITMRLLRFNGSCQCRWSPLEADLTADDWETV